MKESQNIDQTFLVKSVTFALPAIDERIENSAQMLFGTFKKYSYRNDLSKELAARFASMHRFAKMASKKNPDDFRHQEICYQCNLSVFLFCHCIAQFLLQASLSSVVVF